MSASCDPGRDVAALAAPAITPAKSIAPIDTDQRMAALHRFRGKW
jgi:hypothetical protein